MRAAGCRRGLAAAVTVLVAFSTPPAALADVYRWTDESGRVHIADDLNNVPELFRSRVERVTLGPMGGPAARAVPPAEIEPRRARSLAPGERWRGRTFVEWHADLRDATPRVRADALANLAFYGAPAVPALLDGLRDPDPQVRVGAARGLGQIGPAARDAVGVLVAALNDSDPRVRFDVAMAIGRIGPTARDAIPGLGRALRDPAPEVRVGAAMGLGGMGSAAEEMVPGLVQALRDGNAALRITAADALGSIGAGARPAVPALVAALRDNLVAVRMSAASALGSIGPPAREAVPALRALAMGDPGPAAAPARHSPARQASQAKEAALRQDLRSAAGAALRQIEGRDQPSSTRIP